MGIVHDASNAHDPNAMAVRGVANKTIYTAGYLPRPFAAVLAPLVGPGCAANTAVVETVSRGGDACWLEDHRSSGNRHRACDAVRGARGRPPSRWDEPSSADA